MADDIDIEEHDVLDNPRIKNIFPDLTRIKTEVPDSDEDQHMQTKYSDETWVSNTPMSQLENLIRSNHIVLGSKRPNQEDPVSYEGNTAFSNDNFDQDCLHVGSNILQSNVDYEYDENILIKQEPEDSYDEEIERHGSCIILGSKPNKTTTRSHDVNCSVVMLEDWGSRLQRSNCYCKDCKILFPTRNCLDAHNMATHSFLVALSNDHLENPDKSQTVNVSGSANKAVKSTSKNLQFSTKLLLSNPSTSEGKFCNHCNKTFPSDTALITHLYETLTAKKFTCEKCDRFFNKETELNRHIETHHNKQDDDDTSNESQDGLCYRCDICYCYFKCDGYIARHMQKNHSSTFSTEKVPFSGICEFCGSSYSSTSSFNKHVKIFHSQFNLKKGHNSKSSKSSQVLKSKISHNLQPVTSFKERKLNNPSAHFKCLKCFEMFASYHLAKRHKKLIHPEMLNKTIFTKIKRIPVPILKKSLKVKKQIKHQTNHKKFIYKGVTNPPVPKSVLFKCNKCPVHFTNCTDAVFHSYKCVKNTDVWKCDVCTKYIIFNDKIVHERQHIVSDRFDVHLTNENVYGRTLCQCPKCDIYYSEQEFWVHIRQGCGQPRSAPCNVCNILIHVSSTKMHKQLHKNKDFAAKELILIDFVSIENKVTNDKKNVSIGNKRKISEGNNASETKKSKISTDNDAVSKVSRRPVAKIMYYCDKCKNFWKTSRTNLFHRTEKCEVLMKKSTVCKKCGLLKSTNRHDMMHEFGENIFDFRFIRVQDNKVINPMPSYPKCLKCEVHFLTKKSRLRHDCNVDHKICEHCDKRFSEAAYRLHVTFHEYAKRNRNKKTCLTSETKGSLVKKMITAKEKSRKPSLAPGRTKKVLSVKEKSRILSLATESSSRKSSPMPELLEKYELLTETWNILYLCEVCNIICDSYDKMVKHAQDHFNNMESYDMTIKDCKICDFKIDAACFDNHKDLHDEIKTLNRQFFNILKYNYMDLFSDEWFKLFGTLPHHQIEQIMSQSIYVNDRKIRMRITQFGPPKNTVYKCGRCEGYLTASMVGNHFDMSTCSAKRYRCAMCHLDFSMKICLKEHQIVCRTTHQTYREVLFSDINDDVFNKSLPVTQKSDKSYTNITQLKAKGTLYKLYKCDICQCCTTTTRSLNIHRCIDASRMTKCMQCDLFFEKSRGLELHRNLHIKFPKLSKRTVVTISFKPESVKDLPKLYKCKCGLHFTSLQTAEKHLISCEPRYLISKENCSKCGLLFPTSVLVSHLCSHHSNDKRTEFDIIHITPKKRKHALAGEVKNKTNPKITVFKCPQCNICFLSRRAIEYHLDCNHETSRAVEHCDKCGLNLYKDSMTRHLKFHHRLLNCSLGDLNVKVYRQVVGEPIEASVKSYNDFNSQKHTSYQKNIFKDNETPIIDAKYYNKLLYQCSSCGIHFLSNEGCCTHYKRYHTENNKTKHKIEICDICGLKFTTASLARHTKIHHKAMKLNREELVIIPSGMRMNKDLYKCELCDVHFLLQRSYIKHCLKGIHTIRKISCDICGYHFTESSINIHTYIHHDTQKLSREDFKIITQVFESKRLDDGQELLHSETNDDLKVNNQEVHESGVAEKDETQEIDTVLTNRLYRCRTCSVHFGKESDLIDHVSEKSISPQSPRHNLSVAICPHCHLKFTPGKGIDRHIHEQHEQLKLTNKEFVIIENDNVDGTYTSRYLYKCTDCATHFVKEANAEYHKETISKSKCKACDLVFSSADLGDHNRVHHDLMEMRYDDFRFVRIDGKQKCYPPQPLVVQKTRKVITTYKLSPKQKASLNISNYNNSIYLCSKGCGIHYLTLKRYKEHTLVCNGDKDTSASRATCEHCGLLFSAYSLSIHQYIQHNRLKLKFEEFRILTENDLEISSETHPKSFELNEVLDDSVSQTESTEPENLESSQGPNKTVTVSKRLYNDSVSQTESTEQENLESSQGPNKTVTVSKRLYKWSQSYLSSLNINNFSNQLYKCNICKKHFINLHTVIKHRHDVPGANCPDCGLTFTTYILLKHQYIHHEKLGLKLSDFTIHHNFASKTSKVKSNNPLYKCDRCETHFLTFSSAHAHTGEHCVITKVKGQICKACGLKFSDNTLKEHEIEHHYKNTLKTEDFDIIRYSGASRNTKFLDDTDIKDTPITANSTNDNVPEKSTVKANEFDEGDVDDSETSSLHIDVSLDNIDSIVSKPSTADSFKGSSEKVTIKLYKCGDCKVFYITQASCYKHMLNHKKLDSMDYIECKLCGLQFRILTLHKHLIKHHKTDFNLKNVLIEEYQTTSGKTPKIDIYFALDKVQSRLVSTTTDSKDLSEEKVDSTVEDIIGPVYDQENTRKYTSNSEVHQIVSMITVKNISDPTVTEIIANDGSIPVREQIMSQSTVKQVSDSSTDETVSKSVFKVDNCKRISVDRKASKIIVKDVIDCVEQNRTDSIVKDANQVDKDSTVKCFSVPTVDQVVTQDYVKNDHTSLNLTPAQSEKDQFGAEYFKSTNDYVELFVENNKTTDVESINAIDEKGDMSKTTVINSD